MTRRYFEQVSSNGQKRVKCTGCGKVLKRSKTVFQIVSPFNKNPDGTVKSRLDIFHELQKTLEKWRAKPETCKQCSS